MLYRILQVRFFTFFGPLRPPPPVGFPLALVLGTLQVVCSSNPTTVSTAIWKTSSTPRISLLLHST